MFRMLVLTAVLCLAVPCVDSIAADEAGGETEMAVHDQPSVSTAVLGGGCFWCIEAVFEEVAGVLDAVSGYAGGHTDQPDYRAVISGETGHAEVVEITYDPAVISYEEILLIFFGVHDPTTRNRQGPDVGTQYRSIVLYADEQQRASAERVIGDLEQDQVFSRPIVTEVAPLEAFYPAEDYHQDYFRRNPSQGYCRLVIAPKLQEFRRKFADRLQQDMTD